MGSDEEHDTQAVDTIKDPDVQIKEDKKAAQKAEKRPKEQAKFAPAGDVATLITMSTSIETFSPKKRLSKELTGRKSVRSHQHLR